MTDFDPAVFGPPSVRVGTTEREKAAAALGDHFAAGRLDLDEYEERVGSAYSAKTVGELATLFIDLPRPQPAPAPPPPKEHHPHRNLAPVVIVAVLIVAGVVAFTTHIVPFFIFPVMLFLFLRSRGTWPPGRHRFN